MGECYGREDKEPGGSGQPGENCDGYLQPDPRHTAAQKAVAGQFVSVYCKDRTKLLPRPISICEINREAETLRLVYRVTGKGTGTEEFSRLKAGDQVEILGPLGNGFPLTGKQPLVIGGGIGVPPMLGLAQALAVRKGISLDDAACDTAGYKEREYDCLADAVRQALDMDMVYRILEGKE